MPVNNRIEDADPQLAAVYAEAKAAWKKDFPNGPWPELSETHRSNEVQEAYYAQGRQPLAAVNKLRATAGLYLLTAKENKDKVTKLGPGHSKHNTMPSQALDVRFRLRAATKPGGPLQPAGITWDNRFYIQFGGYMIAAGRQLKAAGKLTKKLRWGHDWNGNGIEDETFYDDPHYEVS